MTRPPFSWYGGKIRLSRKIVQLLPEHNIYVEGFGGSGAVLLAKAPAKIEVYNDLDHGLVHFYRTLRDPEKAQRLFNFLSLMPFSREEFDFGSEHWDELDDDIARAAYWFIVARWSFGGIFGAGWSTTGRSWTPTHSATFIRAIDRLPEVHARLRLVHIENCSYEHLIKAHDTSDTVFYFDPPYVPETRAAKDVYAHEMSYDDHVRFIDHMKQIEGKVIISGYASELYDSLLEDPKWTRRNIEVYTSAASAATKKDTRRIECIWVNYAT